MVAIHPGVSDFGAIKQWDPARFGRTAIRLARERGARCLVTWGPGERELAQRVVAAAEGCAALGPETGSILELAALYEACDLVIGADTGPLHLAAALGVPGRGPVRAEGPRDLRALGRAHRRRGARSCGGPSTAARATGAPART